MEGGTEDTANLDDFFAKKDKSKKKGKGKITTDEIEERLERKLKKGKGKSDRDRRDGSGQSSVLDVKVGEDDGEWKDVEEETTKDYTGLRIQNFQLSQREQEEKEREERENGEQGEDSENRGGSQGPWKQTQQIKTTPTPILEPVRETEASKDPGKDTSKDTGSTATKTGKYVPPAARQALRSSAPPLSYTGGSGPAGRRKKTAPNVDSQEDFPSLAFAASQDTSDTVDFERVRGGGRSIEDPNNQMSKLSLENKYGALDSSMTTS